MVEVSLRFNNKAVGPDGYPIDFFQFCWDFIREGMMELFGDFFRGALDIKRLNYGTITLLPKVKDAIRIQQYRPICLLNCIYKWFTKCLTIRLEHVAERIIHKNHTTFIQGRNIMNIVMVLHKILHETKRKKEIGVILKLDFEKAYDKVCWGFLMKCLRMRGFDELWCSWVEKILHNGTIFVKLNNCMGPYFQSFKGVTQRDPLSPLLFNLVADSLTRMVHKAKHDTMLCLQNGVTIHHLGRSIT
jgi:hypothetical protein